MKATQLLSSILLFSLFSFNVIAQNDHLDKAINHAEEAFKAIDGKGIAFHAQKAQPHALAALKQGNYSEESLHNLQAGITALDNAVEKGNLDATDSARQGASDAVRFFKEARK